MRLGLISPLIAGKIIGKNRNFSTLPSKKEKHEYAVYFKTVPLSALPEDFVKTPIHYQHPRELLATIISGGNSRIENRNFWKRCSSAFLHNRHNFTAKEIVKIANAFGKVHHNDRLLFNTIAKQFLFCKYDWDLCDIPILLNAFSESGSYHEELFKACLRSISESIDCIGSTGLSLALGSLKIAGDSFGTYGELIDSLISPVLVNIRQFSVENIITIVSSMGVIKYRNVALLQRISSYLIDFENELSLRQLLTVSQAMEGVDYVDDNMVKLIFDLVCSDSYLITSDCVNLILKFLVFSSRMLKIPSGGMLNFSGGIKRQATSLEVYKNVIAVIIRSQDNIDIKTIYNAKGLLESLGYRDVYLEKLCNSVDTRIHKTFSTHDKLTILKESRETGLPSKFLFRAILNSFKTIMDTSLHCERLNNPNFVSDSEFLELFTLFGELKFFEGIAACLLSLKENPRNVTGLFSLKYHEVLTTHLGSKGEFRSALDASLSFGVGENLVYLCDGHSGDFLSNSLPIRYVGKNPKKIKMAIKENQNKQENTLEIDRRYKLMEFDIKIMEQVWDDIVEKSSMATPLDCTLCICHASSDSYVAGLAERICKVNIKDWVPGEVIPAVLRRILAILKGLLPLSASNMDSLHRMKGVLWKSVACKGELSKLSTRSLCALISLVHFGDCDLDIPAILPILTEKVCERLEDTVLDLDERRFLYEKALLLLDVATRIVGFAETSKLAGCLCSNAKFLDARLMPKLLYLLLQVGYKDKSRLILLEPHVEKAVQINSDMHRITNLEMLCVRLGIESH